MLETIRQYAEQNLDHNPQEKITVQSLHGEYYAEFLRSKENQLEEREQKQALNDIGQQIENVRLAWNWTVSQCEEENIQKFLSSLYLFYDIRGWIQEGEQALAKAKEALMERESVQQSITLGKLLARQGAFYWRLGLRDKAEESLQKSLAIFDSQAAREEMTFSYIHLGDAYLTTLGVGMAKPLFQNALKIFRDIDNRLGIAKALRHLGRAALIEGEYQEARLLHQESLKIFQRIGNQFGTAIALDNLGLVACALGEYTEADQLFKESIVIRRQIGDRWGIASAKGGYGFVAYGLGEFDEARKLFEGSLAIYNEIGDRRRSAVMLKNLGLAASAQQEHRKAAKIYEQSLTISREIGDYPEIASALTHLGNAKVALGDDQAAKKYQNEALQAATDIQATPIILEALIGFAALLVKEGKKEKAAELLALPRDHQASTHATKEKAKLLFAELQAQLSSQEIARAKEKAASAKLEDIVEELRSNI